MKKTDQGVAKGENQRCAGGDPGPERCTSDVIDDGDDGCGVVIEMVTIVVENMKIMMMLPFAF